MGVISCYTYSPRDCTGYASQGMESLRGVKLLPTTMMFVKILTLQQQTLPLRKA